MKNPIRLSVLIDLQDPKLISVLTERLKTLKSLLTDAQVLIGVPATPQFEIVLQHRAELEAAFPSSLELVQYQRSQSMSACAELTFSAVGEHIVFFELGTWPEQSSWDAIASYTGVNAETETLKNGFFWGSCKATPYSHHCFGEPTMASEVTQPGKANGIQLVLINRRNWLRAIARDNALLKAAWNGLEWHQALARELFWGELTSVTAKRTTSTETLTVENTEKSSTTQRTKSELDEIIPPEIKDDEFYNTITQLASSLDISTILEIGSSSGGGSTEAFINGLSVNPSHPVMYCLEVSLPRFQALEQRYGHLPYVRCLNASSVPIASFPSPTEVESFYATHPTKLNQYALPQVLGWLEQDLRYISEWQVPNEGIEEIKSRNHISEFDLVLIDGSEFSGEAEMERVYGARYILLDDVDSMKNFKNRERLLQDPDYELYLENLTLRNGYSVFRRKTKASRFSRLQEILKEQVRAYQPKKIITKPCTGTGLFDIFPSDDTATDICTIVGGNKHSGAIDAWYKERGIRSVTLVEKSPDAPGGIESPLAVALGRSHYRPDLIITAGNPASFARDWAEIRPQLLKNCLIAGISPHHDEVKLLVQQSARALPSLQLVMAQPDDGIALFYYEHGKQDVRATGSEQVIQASPAS